MKIIQALGNRYFLDTYFDKHNLAMVIRRIKVLSMVCCDFDERYMTLDILLFRQPWSPFAVQDIWGLRLQLSHVLIFEISQHSEFSTDLHDSVSKIFSKP